jgi:hypothetical protein
MCPVLSSDHPFSVQVIERSLQNKKMACLEVMSLRLAAHLNRWIDSLKIRRDTYTSTENCLEIPTFRHIDPQ